MVLELEGILHEAAARLSPAHVAALVAHPDALRSALAVAADALSVDDAGPRAGTRLGIETIAGAEPDRVDAGEADRRLTARTARREPRDAPDLGRAGGADRTQDPTVGA